MSCWYETLDRVGGAHHLIVLRAPNASVAGLTEAMWDSRTPAVVYQQFTAVARPWRGRGLAKALKAAILRQAHESHPEAEIMRTGNAETNAVMRAINALAGFEPHRRSARTAPARMGGKPSSARCPLLHPEIHPISDPLG